MGLYQSHILNPQISVRTLFYILTSEEDGFSSEEEIIQQTQSKKCIICNIKEPEYIITTCWHKCLCLKCGNGLKACPICQTKFNTSCELKKVLDF